MNRHGYQVNSQAKVSKLSAAFKTPRPAGSPFSVPQNGARNESQRFLPGSEQPGSSQGRHNSQNNSSQAPPQSNSLWGNNGRGGSEGFAPSRRAFMPDTEGENERMHKMPTKSHVELERDRARLATEKERSEKAQRQGLDVQETAVRKEQAAQKKLKREIEERRQIAIAKKAAAASATPVAAPASSVHGSGPSRTKQQVQQAKNHAAAAEERRRLEEKTRSESARGGIGAAGRKNSKGKGKLQVVLADSDIGSPEPSKRPGSSLVKKAAKRSKSSNKVIDLSSSPEPGPSNVASTSSKLSSKSTKSSKSSKSSPLKKPAQEQEPDPFEPVREPVDLDAMIALKIREDREERRARHALRKPSKLDDLFTDDSASDFDSAVDDDELLIMRDAIPDFLLLDDDDRPDPSTLCPFCSHPFPANPSERLSSLKAHLLALPHVKPAPTSRNPYAMHLPLIEIRSFCRRHKEETVTIPEGEARGWPTEIDWKGLPRRIDRKVGVHLQSVIAGTFNSPFFAAAKEEWESKGARKMANVMSEWGTFDVEQPGYYGLRGSELIHLTLTKLYVDSSALLTPLTAHPLDSKAYIRRVLVPECAVELIRADLDVSRDEALRIRGESCAYGKAKFSMTEEEEQFEIEEEERGEREEREREERERERRRKKRERREAEERNEEEVRERGRRIKAAEKKEAEGPPRTEFRVPKRKIELERAWEEQQPSSSSGSGEVSKPAPKAKKSKGKAPKDDWSTNLRDRSSDEGILDVDDEIMDVDDEIMDVDDEEILDVVELEPELKKKKKKTVTIHLDSDSD